MGLSGFPLATLVLSIVLALVILVLLITLIYSYYFGKVCVEGNHNTLCGLHFGIPKSQRPQIANSKPRELLEFDLEKQVYNTDFLQYIPPIRPAGSTNNSGDNVLGYQSAADTFDRVTEGLFGSPVELARSSSQNRIAKRMSFVKYKRDHSKTLHAVVEAPSRKSQLYLSDQYDSFSRTLMLQHLIQSSVNQEENAIKKVRDPFLGSTISVGGIVVVVKPFHGINDYEFTSLQNGDLLRVVKFYIKHFKDKKARPLSMESLTTPRSSGSTLDGYNMDLLDKTDPNYDKIYCTGIILSTYLEFNRDSFLLKVKEDETGESELLKDFPLRIVSLETTLLKQMTRSDLIQELD